MQEVQKDIEKIQVQLSKPEPNRSLILKRVESLVNLLANSATIAAAAPQLVELGRRALEWANMLF